MLTQWKLHVLHERPEASQDTGELGIRFKDSSFVCEMLHKGSCSQEWARALNHVSVFGWVTLKAASESRIHMQVWKATRGDKEKVGDWEGPEGEGQPY